MTKSPVPSACIILLEPSCLILKSFESPNFALPVSGKLILPLTNNEPVKLWTSSMVSPNSVEPDEVAIIWLTNSVLNSFAIIDPEVEILPETCSEPVIPTFPATVNFSWLLLSAAFEPMDTESFPPSINKAWLSLFVSTLKLTSSLSWLITTAPDDNSTLFELAATSSIKSPRTWILLWFCVEELSPISIFAVPSVDKNLAAVS